MGSLLAGAASAVVTPPVGYRMGAWGLRQGRSTGVHDDLFAKALVLENDDVRLAIVAMDVAGITREILEHIQDRVLELTGIPASHLLVNSTHNHTTPDFINAIPEELETYAKVFADNVAGAVLEASAHMSPATAGHGWGDLPGMTINRQYKEQPIDTSVGVLRVDHADGAPLARVINFACHNLCVGGQYLDWSADFTGVATGQVEVDDPGAVCMFISGAGGDIHPFDWWFGNTDSEHMETFEDAAELGTALGDVALGIIEKIEPVSDVPLNVATSMVNLPRQKPSWTVEAARQQHEVLVEELGVYQGETWAVGTNTANAGMLNPAIYGNGMTQLLMAERQDMPPIRADLQAFQIGDLLISASPGELFNELGSQIKQGGGAERTWVASYTGNYIGYISTRLPHEETAVIPLVEIVDQTRFRRYYGTTTSPFAPEAGEMLVAESIALLKKLA
ncbi:MAG: hypothetical protein HQ478_05465 [Chloroflexi bacterium]|nr:hypothetical protein [Chloroflexota bacterium]